MGEAERFSGFCGCPALARPGLSDSLARIYNQNTAPSVHKDSTEGVYNNFFLNSIDNTGTQAGTGRDVGRGTWGMGRSPPLASPPGLPLRCEQGQQLGILGSAASAIDGRCGGAALALRRRSRARGARVGRDSIGGVNSARVRGARHESNPQGEDRGTNRHACLRRCATHFCNGGQICTLRANANPPADINLLTLILYILLCHETLITLRYHLK